MIAIIITFFVSIISLYIFRRMYLRSNDQVISSNKNTEGIIFLISGLIPSIVDIIWNGKEFGGIEILVVAIILSCSTIYRSTEGYKSKSFKEKYLLSLSFNLSSVFLYLIFLTIYFIAILGELYGFDWKNLVSLFFSFIPNLLSRLILLFPFLLIITIIISIFRKGNQMNQKNHSVEDYDKDILDSNIF